MRVRMLPSQHAATIAARPCFSQFGPVTKNVRGLSRSRVEENLAWVRCGAIIQGEGNYLLRSMAL